jgi:hypothetical protein
MDTIFSQHALQQMFKRNISIEQVKHAIINGEEIRSYPDDKPYPSKLLLAFENELPLHVIIAQDFAENKNIVITAYHPDSNIWIGNFKTRQ